MKRNKGRKFSGFFSFLSILIVVTVIISFKWNSLGPKLVQIQQSVMGSKIVQDGQPVNITKQVDIKKVDSDEERIKRNILLVNRTHKLDDGFVPENLRVPNVQFISYADPNVKRMSSEAATALENMFLGAQKDGFTLLAVSGYRDYDYQKRLYSKQLDSEGSDKTNKYLAGPGSSEHQSGLAMDLLSTEYKDLDDGFANTKTYQWLEQNCAKYGFIIRYPKDKENVTKYSFEPWHLRYVGVIPAEKIVKNKLTLEEYLNKLD